MCIMGISGAQVLNGVLNVIVKVLLLFFFFDKLYKIKEKIR